MAKARPSIEGTCYDALGLCLWSRTLGVGRTPIRFASTCPRVGTFVRPFHSIAGDFEGEVVVELRTWEGRFQVHVFPLDLGLVGRLRHGCGKVRRLRSGSELPWSRGTGRRIIHPSVHPSIQLHTCRTGVPAHLSWPRFLSFARTIPPPSRLGKTSHPPGCLPFRTVHPSICFAGSPFQARPFSPFKHALPIRGGEGEGASRS